MFSKRENIAAAHNQVIEDFDVNHPQHLRQTLGDQLVSLTGFSESGRMVMRQYHGGGIMMQGALQDDTRMNGDTVDSSLKQFFKGDHAILTVEKERAE